MDRTIKVTGKGRLLIKPDLIRIVMNLEDTYERYEETLEQSAKQVEVLKTCFEELGFEGKDLKTLSFHIDTKYESYQDSDKAWKQRFAGYEFKHSLKIEFDADNEMLGKVLWMLAHASIKPEFKIIYTVKDTEASKNLLLGKAVVDAKEKAKVLAEAAGVQLQAVLTVDYSWSEAVFTSSPMNRMLSPMSLEESLTAKCSYDINIEPEDLDVSDTVTVIWSIS